MLDAMLDALVNFKRKKIKVNSKKFNLIKNEFDLIFELEFNMILM